MENDAAGLRETAEAAAAAWLVRRESDAWNEATEAQLQAWIEADFNHRAAWLRLSHAWKQADCLKTLMNTASAGQIPLPEQLHVPLYDAAPVNGGASAAVPAADSASGNSLRNAWRYGAVAAMLAIVLGAGGTWLLRDPTYRTELGALEAVPLDDGSRITLNTDTVIRVHLTKSARHIELEKGEAYFEVAKDPQRPFVVSVGEQKVSALGTQFSVRRDGEGVRVVVTEGVVRLEGSGAAEQISSKGAAVLRAGATARTGGAGLVIDQQSATAAEEQTSWRSGLLIFDDTPLATAVAEFNRYNARNVVIEDPAIAAIPVGGTFRSTNVEAFIRLIETDFPVIAIRDGNRIRLLERAHREQK